MLGSFFKKYVIICIVYIYICIYVYIHMYHHIHREKHGTLYNERAYSYILHDIAISRM